MLENIMLIDFYYENLWAYTDEPQLEEDILDVEDDERDELIEKFGSMSKVDPDVLADIVRAHTGIDEVVGIEWDDRFDTIVYKYFPEVA